jgi:hypothetical protein
MPSFSPAATSAGMTSRASNSGCGAPGAPTPAVLRARPRTLNRVRRAPLVPPFAQAEARPARLQPACRHVSRAAQRLRIVCSPCGAPLVARAASPASNCRDDDHHGRERPVRPERAISLAGRRPFGPRRDRWTHGALRCWPSFCGEVMRRRLAPATLHARGGLSVAAALACSRAVRAQPRKLAASFWCACSSAPTRR